MTDLNSHDFRPTEPVEVVLKSKTFANGAMRYPGDRIVLDPKVFQEPDSQRAMRKKNHNIVLASDARAPISIPVPVAPIGPSGPNPDKPQGIPSGAVDAGGRIVFGTSRSASSRTSWRN